MEDLEKLAREYGETIKGVHLLNIQRLGLSTNLDEEAVKLRAKLIVNGGKYHKPVINNPRSPYVVQAGEVEYLGKEIGVSIEIKPDFPEPNYKRGNNILVVNSTFMEPCNQGCRFCEQTTASLDKRRYSIVLQKGEVFDKFLEEEGINDLRDLSQISIVTSCAGTEEGALSLIRGYVEEARKRRFDGRFLFATHELTSRNAISSLDEKVILAFTVECFDNRREVMPSRKGDIELDEIRRVLSTAYKRGEGSTYFYIFGLDSLDKMRDGFLFLRDSITVAPTGPNYQPQGNGFSFPQKSLKYFLKARQVYSEAHRGLFRFEAAQNYRSLWPLENNKKPTLVE